MAMNNKNLLDQILPNVQFAVHDGGIATELEHVGGVLDKHLWSAISAETQPDKLKQVHRLYLESGCNILTTASYQFSFEAFQMHKNLDRDEAESILLKSVQICDEARREYLNEHPEVNRPILIAASLSCYGASIGSHEFDGDYIDTVSELFLKEFHRDRINCFLNLFKSKSENSSRYVPVPDILLFETVPVLKEAQIICEVLEEELAATPEFNQELPLPVIISFSCKNGEQTCHGENITTCVEQLAKYPFVSAIGINCTHPRYIGSLVKLVDSVIADRERYSLHLMVYPNSGDVWDSSTSQFIPCAESKYAEDYGQTLVQIVKQAVGQPPSYKIIIGGCCRVRPKQIAQIRDSITMLSLSGDKS